MKLRNLFHIHKKQVCPPDNYLGGHALKREYIAVTGENLKMYGGNQMRLGKKYLRSGGCGLIAAANLVSYLRGDVSLTEEEYLALIKEIRWCFPLLYSRGLNGISLAIGINRCFRKLGLPYKAVWGVRASKILSRMEKMLSRDIPVIFSVGPDFPLMWRSKKVTLYKQDSSLRLVPAASTSAHYMTATAIRGDFMRVSSWGTEYYVRLSDFLSLAGGRSPVLTNICYVRGKGKRK
ncbi:MAG: hypothetical protein MJ067_03625 [Oscillospiraceae bacterium]|nr:hypothetical protein [Oscillospiraceae bacterium]